MLSLKHISQNAFSDLAERLLAVDIRFLVSVEKSNDVKGKILEESTVYTDGWKSYHGLIYQGFQHYRIYHSKNEFTRGKNHINGIESFWSFVKRRMAKQNGVRKDKFLLHLKES